MDEVKMLYWVYYTQQSPYGDFQDGPFTTRDRAEEHAIIVAKQPGRTSVRIVQEPE